MTEKDMKAKVAAIEKELASIRKALAKVPTAGARLRAIRVPTYVPQEKLDALAHQLERQKTLIQVLREILPEFGQKFDTLCSDKEKSTLSPSVPDVEKAVFGEEDL
jgi:hypothetical protein